MLLGELRGRLWRERTFYRDLWKPAQEASGLAIRPHERRHSYVTHLRAAGVNDADLAEIAGAPSRDDAGPPYAMLLGVASPLSVA